jgi:protease IV
MRVSSILYLLSSVFFPLLPGCGIPSFLVTPVQNTSKLEELAVEPWRGFSAGKIAIIGVEGMLANFKSGGFLQPTENPLSLFTQELEAAQKDSAVKAIVLRVNSPGGTVSTSDAIYEEILRFKAATHKPVVASFQEVAASGAYYLSCASDKIVAQPTSVVGSIGVVFYTFDFSGSMNKIGARAEAVKSGPLKDMGSPFKPLTPQERAVMQGMIDEYYGRFVGVLTRNRPVSAPENLALVTDGRVFSGNRAKELGLVDEVGLLQDAISLARKLSSSPNAAVIMYKRPYAYGGSIYAAAELPQPQANTMRLELPAAGSFLPAGFYYLWNP